MPGQRSPFIPHPIYGITKGGFTIADLGASNDSGVQALTNAAVDTTSAAVKLGSNGIEVHPTFSDPVTTCSVQVINNADQSVIKQWDNVSMANAGTLYLGYYDIQDLLAGKTIKIRAFNFVGGGNVSVKIKKLS